nr:MAG TPA: hypothetical protein [Caudoviricetes sp.]DAY71932.1 MAG TPA: hypothetical protein [Caudoviricetes sp.]
MLNVIKLNFFLREYKNKAIYQKKICENRK